MKVICVRDSKFQQNISRQPEGNKAKCTGIKSQGRSCLKINRTRAGYWMMRKPERWKKLTYMPSTGWAEKAIKIFTEVGVNLCG